MTLPKFKITNTTINTLHILNELTNITHDIKTNETFYFTVCGSYIKIYIFENYYLRYKIVRNFWGVIKKLHLVNITHDFKYNNNVTHSITRKLLYKNPISVTVKDHFNNQTTIVTYNLCIIVT